MRPQSRSDIRLDAQMPDDLFKRHVIAHGGDHPSSGRELRRIGQGLALATASLAWSPLPDAD